MPSQYLHSGEPLPDAPPLEGEYEDSIAELNVFHAKVLDYLRRLTAKLSSDIFSPPQLVSVETIALTLSGNFTPSDPDTIDWDQIVRMDAPFSYSTDTPLTGKITFLQAGFYLILLDIYSTDVTYTIQLKDGDGNTIPYGDLTSQMSVGTMSMSSAVPVHMHEGQTLEVQITSSVTAIVALYTRLTILKLGDFPSSGGSDIDPCELDIWQLCP